MTWYSISGRALGRTKPYELNVYDCSQHGIGILITEKDFNFIGDNVQTERKNHTVRYGSSP
jgi:hypothetical protein